ncbi:MAG: tetratricopeptide repeat protein [Myxococcaceae bacterium]|nr:tetratricopeptide repeat protein [Myxococcaceae bacterium]
MKRLVASAVLAFSFGCATQESATKNSATATGATPEVPYTPKTVVQTNPSAQGQASPPSAEAAAPQPAPAPAPPPEVPKYVYSASAQSAFQRGVEAASRGDVAAAQKAFEEAADADAKADYAWTNLGMVRERQGDDSGAEKAYRKAISLKPDQDMAWDSLARLYCRTRRCPQIESEVRNKIAEMPASLGLRNALVYTLSAQAKYDAAATEAKKVLKADERNVRAMQLLAKVYAREGKHELAKMVLENARAVDGSNAGVHNALGLTYLALKQKPQALESFKQAVTLRPDFAEAKNNYGVMLNEAQDYDAAVKELEGAVTSAPDFTAARMNLGNAYRGKQDFSKAMTQYKEVMRLSPGNADPYFNLAILHLDSEIPGMDTTERLKTSLSYFAQYQDKGGKDDRVEQYVKDANKGIEKEERRKEREKRDALKKAEKAEKDKKAEADKAANAQKAADDQAAEEKKKAEEAKKKAAADAKKKPGAKLSDDSAPAPATKGKLSDNDK